jgi:predicted nuclease with TOPRIM domain
MTVNATHLNALFVAYLKELEFKQDYEADLRQAITEGLKRRLAHVFEESVQLKKRISELQGQLEGVEERFVLGQIPPELFEKYAKKYKTEIVGLEAQLFRSAFDSSNLKKTVEKGASNCAKHKPQLDIGRF